MGTAIGGVRGCHSAFREGPAGLLTCTRHVILSKPMNQLSLEDKEGSWGAGGSGREQGGKGMGGGGRRRSEAPAVYLLSFEQSTGPTRSPLTSSPTQGWGCLAEGTEEPETPGWQVSGQVEAFPGEGKQTDKLADDESQSC